MARDRQMLGIISHKGDSPEPRWLRGRLTPAGATAITNPGDNKCWQRQGEAASLPRGRRGAKMVQPPLKSWAVS